MQTCVTCPHDIGDSFERDCCFPGCVGWHIEKNMKPIPDRSHDFDFWHDDSDDTNSLCGTAISYEDAIKQIIEIISVG